MACIYFHSIHGDAELSDAERAWMTIQTSPKQIPGESELDYNRRFYQYRFSDDPESLRLATDYRNELLKTGDDITKLMLRIDGQCEIHCYVEGSDREWLVEIVSRGLSDGRFHAGMGWLQVETLLRSHSDSPVVLSYSVCDQFPSLYAVPNWRSGSSESRREAAWGCLTFEKRWEIGMRELRSRNRHARIRLDPREWTQFFFSGGSR